GVGRLLRSRLVLGQRTHKGRVVLGDDGMPVRFADPILSDQEWEAVQAVLDGQKIAVKRREGDQALLRDLAYCECGHKLYRFVQRTKRHGTYVYYRCAAAVQGESCESEEHTSELQSRENLVCRLLLEKKNETLLA